MGKKHPYYGKSMSINFPDFSYTMGFVAFSRTVGNLWGNPCIFHMLKYTIGWELDGKKAPTPWEKYGYRMVIDFSDFPHTMGFVEFSRTVGNLQGNPCISHMLFPKYTIRWESNGKKAPMLWEKYEYQFPRLFPYHGFCCIFPYCGKFTGKPIYLPYDDIG